MGPGDARSEQEANQLERKGLDFLIAHQKLNQLSMRTGLCILDVHDIMIFL